MKYQNTIDWMSAEQFAELLRRQHIKFDADFVHIMALVKEPLPSPRWANGKPLWQSPEAHAWAHSLYRARRDLQERRRH